MQYLATSGRASASVTGEAEQLGVASAARAGTRDEALGSPREAQAPESNALATSALASQSSIQYGSRFDKGMLLDPQGVRNAHHFAIAQAVIGALRIPR